MQHVWLFCSWPINQTTFLLIRVVRVFTATLDWLSGSNLLAALLTFLSTYFHSHGDIVIYHNITSLIRVRFTSVMDVVSVVWSFDCYKIECRILPLDTNPKKMVASLKVRGMRRAKQITCNAHAWKWVEVFASMFGTWISFNAETGNWHTHCGPSINLHEHQNGSVRSPTDKWIRSTKYRSKCM